MEKNTWKYVKKLKEEDSVDKFLEANKIIIPERLKKCLIENNGGRPSLDTFDTNKRIECEFKSLLSFNEDDKETIYMVYDQFKDSKKFPFATDSAGNVICYDYENKIYLFYNHELDEYEEIKSLQFI